MARRDVVLAHLWQNPQLYRGIPIHLLGTANRVLRYPSKLAKTGWLYEAWVITPETTRLPYVCVFEDVPEGFPIGPNVSERVVFNGYFLKIMKYQAADVTRGAPVLVGRIGWERAPAGFPGSRKPALALVAGDHRGALFHLAGALDYPARLVVPGTRPGAACLPCPAQRRDRLGRARRLG